MMRDNTTLLPHFEGHDLLVAKCLGVAKNAAATVHHLRVVRRY